MSTDNKSIFEDVHVDWKGKRFRIKANDMLRCIMQIEDVITLGEIHAYSTSHAVPLAKLAAAYARVLRFAGARVTDEDVYVGMFGDSKMVEAIAEAISTLLLLMVPPQAVRDTLDAKVGTDSKGGEDATSAPGKPGASESAVQS